MGYREIRRFRDGTVMVEINGEMTIVGAEEGNMYKEQNWPAVVAKRLQKQFSHMIIQYVDEEMPGISIASFGVTIQSFCNWNKETSPEEIYASALDVVSTTEGSAIKNDPNYFLTHYIKIKSYD